ncbi:PREDICTED: protein pitchfork isoform X2 [Chinchilla lanigera]|uniref:protein pitchfork isoform X2 n=1 Tax=Chinchilla lanigera TaxID=34839 RepID=UPI00038EF03C|nr:PREDICTED: protein pitchfork isoform X2 [Chinchilla lanigera]
METIYEKPIENSYDELFKSRTPRKFTKSEPYDLPQLNTTQWNRQPFLWDFALGAVNVYSFGTRQQRKLFPLYHPPNQLGNYFLPIRGSPHTGPGHYIPEDYGLAHQLCKIPTSTKGYALGARTAVRFKPLTKDVTPCPGKYQKVNTSEEKHKQNFAPFNVLIPRSGNYSKDSSSPGPGTYNPDKKPPPKVAWPMKFGSPDWAQVPYLQKRTLKAELSTDREFRKHRNRVAYFRLFYN